MRFSLLLALPLVLGACAQVQGPSSAETRASQSPLVSLSEGGELVEVERKEEYSVIEVRRTPSGSVASSMYVLRGACAVARARGQVYFASTAVGGPLRSYRIVFPKTPSEEQLRGSTKSVFSMADCVALRF